MSAQKPSAAKRGRPMAIVTEATKKAAKGTTSIASIFPALKEVEHEKQSTLCHEESTEEAEIVAF